MIITRSPLRISLGGGGTDLPSYYEKQEGFLIAAAIDKYVYITIHRTFVEEMIVKYSKLERVMSVNELEHPIIREAFKLAGLEGNYLEVASMADIPAGTGLGSSGSFTTALLKALHTLNKRLITPQELAEQACHIEIERLREPIGKQDQYIAAYGGLTAFSFARDGKVTAQPVAIPDEHLHNLEDSLVMFFTGYTRNASAMLKEQDSKSRENDEAMLKNLDCVKEMGVRSLSLLEEGRLKDFALLMHEHWEQKKKRSSGISNPRIDEWYKFARRNGALGGKLIGAGGGGFFLLYTEDKKKLRHAMLGIGMKEVRFRFDFEGAKVVVQ